MFLNNISSCAIHNRYLGLLGSHTPLELHQVNVYEQRQTERESQGGPFGARMSLLLRDPLKRCAALDPILTNQRQRELCRQHIRTLEVAALGASLGIDGIVTIITSLDLLNSKLPNS